MSKKSREKGKRGEREARDILRSLGFLRARRGVQYAGGPDSPDIAEAIPGVHVEVKRQERLNIWAAIEQAEADSEHGEVPLILFRRSRSEWQACLPARLLVLFAELMFAELGLSEDEIAHGYRRLSSTHCSGSKSSESSSTAATQKNDPSPSSSP